MSFSGMDQNTHKKMGETIENNDESVTKEDEPSHTIDDVSVNYYAIQLPEELFRERAETEHLVFTDRLELIKVNLFIDVFSR